MKFAIIAAAAVALAGCGGSNYRDIEGVPLIQPDKIEVFGNVDQNPNLVRLCIDGAAFVTSSRKGGAAWRRAEYFDAWCAEVADRG